MRDGGWRSLEPHQASFGKFLSGVWVLFYKQRGKDENVNIGIENMTCNKYVLSAYYVPDA